MDDCSLKYGWMTTYEKTILVKRTGKYSLLLSPSIPHGQASTASLVSVREALLFLALQDNYKHPKTGDTLVGIPSNSISLMLLR